MLLDLSDQILFAGHSPAIVGRCCRFTNGQRIARQQWPRRSAGARLRISLILTPVGRRRGPRCDIHPAEPEFDLASHLTNPAGPALRTPHSTNFDTSTLVSGPKLRRILDVSPVTLWRWRHDKTMGFPAAKRIQVACTFLGMRLPLGSSSSRRSHEWPLRVSRRRDHRNGPRWP